MMKKLLITLLMVSTCSFSQEIYTVDDLIIKAMNNSPDLKISAGRFESSKSKTDIAFGSYLPKLDLHVSAGEHGQENIPYEPDTMISDRLIMGQISLKQLIYDFGKTSGNVDSKRHLSTAFEMNNIQAISNKIRDVKSAYYLVLKAISLIDVQKENIKLNEAQLYRAKQYFKAGIRTKIDISDAKVRLIKAELELKTAQYDLKAAYASLDERVGFTEIKNDYEVFSKKLELDNIYDKLAGYELNLQESISFAYENRYKLKEHDSLIQSANAKKRLASSDYYPAFYFDADYARHELDKFDHAIPQDKWQASLKLDWNLYRGGASQAFVQEEIINIQIQQSKYQKQKLSIKKATTDAYLELYKTKDMVKLSQSLVEVSNEKFEQSTKRYENGLTDYIELQQSRQDYIDAKAYLVVNYYSYYQAIAYLDNAIGK